MKSKFLLGQQFCFAFALFLIAKLGVSSENEGRIASLSTRSFEGSVSQRCWSRFFFPAVRLSAYVELGTYHPQIYSIRSASGKISHILGSIHTGIDRSEIPDYVVNLMHESDTFLFEGGIVDSLSLTQKLALRHSESTPPVRELIRRAIEDGLAPNHPFYKLTPHYQRLVSGWAGLQTNPLQVLHKLSSTGYLEGGGDLEILRWSHDHGKSIRTLETEDEVEDATKSVVIDLDFLEGPSVDDLSFVSEKVTTNRLILQSLRGLNAKEFALKELNSMSPYAREVLVNRRNVLWIKNSLLLSTLDEGRAFVVVGMIHLFGEKGLIRKLKKRGYEIEKVTPAL